VIRFSLAAALCVSVAVAADTAPVFTKDVAPILYQNCVSCHRPGEIAPMSLLTYEQVRPWAKSIREKVSSGQMPPWHADAPRETFLNDRRLSDNDKNTLLRWVEAGAPQGDPKDLPPVPKFTDGWEIGQPDATFSMSKAYEVPAQGTIAYQNFSVPTNFTEDKWIQAIEVRPGNRSVVHHILVFASAPERTPLQQPYKQVVPNFGSGRGGERPASGPGTLIATTAPGTNAMVYQAGSAVLIKAGSTLRFQVHYTASGKSATDISSVGMIFAKGTPKTEIKVDAFMNPTMKVAAGSSDTAVDTAIEFDQDSHIWALFPHAHLRGKSWEYRVIYPDGRKQVVLSVPNYDFNWQTYYVFAEPLAVPKGSRLEATGYYDNSANNKWNPDPTIEVKWGEQTWEEMQYSGIMYSVDKP
jgi:hypothetical protein